MSVQIDIPTQETQAGQGTQPPVGAQGFQDSLVDPLAEQAAGDEGDVQFKLLNDKTTAGLT